VAAWKRVTNPAPGLGSVVRDPNARWQAVIARCLERDPARRPATVEAVLEALTQNAVPRPTKAPTRALVEATFKVLGPNGAARMLRAMRRPALVRWRALGAAALAMVVAAIALVGLRAGHHGAALAVSPSPPPAGAAVPVPPSVPAAVAPPPSPVALPAAPPSASAGAAPSGALNRTSVVGAGPRDRRVASASSARRSLGGRRSPLQAVSALAPQARGPRDAEVTDASRAGPPPAAPPARRSNDPEEGFIFR
jgi:hypothetical protein